MIFPAGRRWYLRLGRFGQYFGVTAIRFWIIIITGIISFFIICFMISNGVFVVLIPNLPFRKLLKIHTGLSWFVISIVNHLTRISDLWLSISPVTDLHAFQRVVDLLVSFLQREFDGSEEYQGLCELWCE